jgi:hypothetical protein
MSDSFDDVFKPVDEPEAEVAKEIIYDSVTPTSFRSDLARNFDKLEPFLNKDMIPPVVLVESMNDDLKRNREMVELLLKSYTQKELIQILFNVRRIDVFEILICLQMLTIENINKFYNLPIASESR